MHEDVAQLENLAIVMAVAVGLGLLLIRLRLPAMVGYIAAGVALGPYGFGLVRSTESVDTLAEMGVLMLLFIAGMEIRTPAFRRVLRPAVIAAVGVLAASIALTFALSTFTQWDWRAAITLAFIISLSSTAVALKILEESDELNTRAGEVAIGLAIAQDILVVPMLITVEGLREETPDLVAIALRVVLAIGVLAAVIYAFRRGAVLDVPLAQRLRGRTDLLALLALATCFGAASLSGVLGLSAAYGAFLAGLIVGNTSLREDMVRAASPIQSLLLVVFFLSVGLLIDGGFIAENVLLVLGASMATVMVKTVLNIAFLRLAGLSRDDAIMASLASSQIGEFSFILASVGLAAAVLDAQSYRLAIAIIAATLLISPVWAILTRRIHNQALAALGRVRLPFNEPPPKR